IGDVGLVVDHKDQRAQLAAPGVTGGRWSARGNLIVNCVKTPRSVSTSIVPACCLTTMSWLSERPSPVPSPAGLVVKNGLKIRSLISGGIPVPLSRMRISTLSPRSLVVAVSFGSSAAVFDAGFLVA